MTRIAHISDLHLAKPGAPVLPESDRKLLHSVGEYLLQETGISLNVRIHDQQRLDALNMILGNLRPDVIVVTGDLTTYGDRDSMRWAADILEGWKTYGRVLTVPGNHDALQERLTGLKNQGGVAGSVASALGKFVNSFENLLVKHKSSPTTQSPPFLEVYRREIEQRLNCNADPAIPVWIETAWGWLCLFLFNSVNEPGWMANEGRVGAAQYNRLNRALGSETFKERKGESLRFALLHHHPLPVPYMADLAAERFYDDMQDGSTLCHYLNTQDFHFVLHGHKHRPYMCRVQYDGTGSLYVLAAGTATQSSEDQTNASFNVIDIVSPFQALVRRYEYRPTGYQENIGHQRTAEPKPVSSIRYTEGVIEKIADQDLRNLLTINPNGLESNHRFSLISWEATVTNDCYLGQYRLVGNCCNDNVEGLRQVLTGSPDRSWTELGVQAWEGQNVEQTVACKVIEDHPRQKCFELCHVTIGMNTQAFDYTYEFRWQNDIADDTYFDAFNLFYYSLPIQEFRYSIILPWKPGRARVETVGLVSARLSPLDEKVEVLPDERFRYSFSLKKPKLLLYVVRLPRFGEPYR